MLNLNTPFIQARRRNAEVGARAREEVDYVIYE